MIYFIVTGIVVIFLSIGVKIYFKKNLHYWAVNYFRLKTKNFFVPSKIDRKKPIDLFIAIADHFEPGYGAAPMNQQIKRVDKWVSDYPVLSDSHRDFLRYKPATYMVFPTPL